MCVDRRYIAIELKWSAFLEWSLHNNNNTNNMVHDKIIPRKTKTGNTVGKYKMQMMCAVCRYFRQIESFRRTIDAAPSMACGRDNEKRKTQPYEFISIHINSFKSPRDSFILSIENSI